MRQQADSSSSSLRRRRRSRHPQSPQASAAPLLLLALVLAASAPSAVHGFQYAVLSSTSCQTLAYSISLESWEYKAASFLRTSLGDPEDPTRYTQVEIDNFFTRSQLQSPFVTKWNRPLPAGGDYTLYFALLDRKGNPIKQLGDSASLDTVTVTLTIPPCAGSSSPVQTSQTKSSAAATKSTPAASSSVATPTITVTSVLSTSPSPSSPLPASSSLAGSANPSESPGPSSSSRPPLIPGAGSGTSDANATSSKSSSISTAAMAGAVIGAIAATLFLLWLLALCRRRVLRSVNNNKAQRASYLGPAPRPLLTPSNQSARYYHTPSPGNSIMPPQSKTAAFFAFLTGRQRRRRSVILGIPAVSPSRSSFAPTMRQMSHNHISGGVSDPALFGPEHPRRSVGTITPILRRPEDGFMPVGTAEQVAARRLSRESAVRSGSVTGHHPVSRPGSASEHRFVSHTGPGQSPLDASDPYAYHEAAATGNLVDTSDLLPPNEQELMQQIPMLPNLGSGTAAYPRPFLLGGQRPTSHSSSRSGQSKASAPATPAQPVASGSGGTGRPPSQTAHHGGGGGGGTNTRPGSACSALSQSYGAQQGQQPYIHPHKMNRPRNNDWATPYTPSLARQHTGGSQQQQQLLANSLAGGRSRSSSASSASGATALAYRLGGIGLGLSSASGSGSGSGTGTTGQTANAASPGSNVPPFSQSPYQSPTSARASGPTGGGSGGGGAAGAGASAGTTGTSPMSGLIPLQLAGSASSHLVSSAYPRDGSGPGPATAPEANSLSSSFYGSHFGGGFGGGPASGSGSGSGGQALAAPGRARAGSSASSSSNMAGMGSGAGAGGAGDTRVRTSMFGPTPIVPAMLGGGGSSSGNGGSLGGIFASMMGSGPNSHSSSPIENLAATPPNPSSAFASPLLTAISPPAPTATATTTATGPGGPTSFLPRSGASTPVRSNSTSPGPSTTTAASGSTTTTAGGVFAPRKRPSFSYSNDPVAYMQATAGFARPPSRANSISSVAGPAHAPPVDQSNPLFAALSALDD
ncbi:hypothetical protein OC835_001423 [Tilletia horrida]|nr:hypothetical protein OC835_001423 [Tilletia horrida]